MSIGSNLSDLLYGDEMRDEFGATRAAEILSLRPIEQEDNFLLRIAQECRRAERSRKRFILVLVHGCREHPEGSKGIAAKLAKVTREIDVIGWYETDTTLGVLLLELGDASVAGAAEVVSRRVKEVLRNLPSGDQLEVSVHSLPRNVNEDGIGGNPERVEPFLKPLSSPELKTRLAIKRFIDLTGSILLLVLLSPVVLVVALLVKLSSPGPVLFRQKRVGHHGKCFTFLKFRSMAVASDPTVHEKYAKDFIRGTAERHTNEKGEGVFKLTRDLRVTRVGGFLRKTSLDELPQLWNVLVGDMSLVGPRPPIPYEVECYDLWHQRRLLEVKPGITGLWQVSGRSRVAFNDMVRLDLQYARTWSLWLDLKILAKTPLAVIGDPGAH